MTATTDLSPVLLLTGVVRDVQELSPSFVRITLGGNGFDQIGPEGHTLDQRIKLLIPTTGNPVPSAIADSANWYAAWLALPETDRGHLRTYTARRIVGEGDERCLVVDFVLHGTDSSAGHEAAGPAATWAAGARPGDEVGVVAPRRGHEGRYGGIEFAPGAARRLLLVADETALPALASILESLPSGASGTAVIEVPSAADFLDVTAPARVRLHWIARADRPRGMASLATLRSECGLPRQTTPAVAAGGGPTGETDDEVWETPVYSSSGEPIEATEHLRDRVGAHETYAWVAGDSDTVKACRRLLVGELGLPRPQVAFMGYWKQGRAG